MLVAYLSSYTPPIATNKTLHKKKLHQTNRECIKAFQTQHASCIDNATIDFFSNLWLITDERADLDVLPEVYDQGTGFVLFTTKKPCTYGHAKDDEAHCSGCKDGCVGPDGDWIGWYRQNRLRVPTTQRVAIDYSMSFGDPLDIDVRNAESYIDLTYHCNNSNGLEDGDDSHSTAASPLSLAKMPLNAAIALIAHGHKTNHLMNVNVAYV